MTDDTALLKIFPAINGDAMLLSIAGFNLLIDSGYVETYSQYVKPSLIEIQAGGGKLDLMVITHIDADHISGAIKFLTEQLQAPIISVENIWHNSYRHLSKFTSSTVINSFDGKDVETLPVKSIIKHEQQKDKEISASQGSSLAALIQRGDYPWNMHFKQDAVSIDNVMTVKLTDKISLTLLSPNNKKLEDLYKHWKKELFKLGYRVNEHTKPFDDAFEFVIGTEKNQKRVTNKDVSAKKIDLDVLAAADFPEDDRISNGSSIAFFVECDGRKVLFLADSHPSLVSSSLKKIFKQQDFPVKFDAIKISHHGSVQNTSRELLSLIDSEHFIISTNGTSYNHPDIETISRIVTRKSNYKRTIYFNYSPEVASAVDDPTLMAQYNYCVVVGTGMEPLEIRI
jgi:beta-lactamase superfamily II metal-dependent hydrolase